MKKNNEKKLEKILEQIKEIIKADEKSKEYFDENREDIHEKSKKIINEANQCFIAVSENGVFLVGSTADLLCGLGNLISHLRDQTNVSEELLQKVIDTAMNDSEKDDQIKKFEQAIDELFESM